VYSFGVLMWEVFTLAELPFAEFSNEEVHERVRTVFFSPT
jgi:hypothetical protein